MFKELLDQLKSNNGVVGQLPSNELHCYNCLVENIEEDKDRGVNTAQYLLNGTAICHSCAKEEVERMIAEGERIMEAIENGDLDPEDLKQQGGQQGPGRPSGNKSPSMFSDRYKDL